VAYHLAMLSALELIHEYYKVFSTLDVQAIASYFSEPCMTLTPHGPSSAANRAALANSLLPLIAAAVSVA
jgi:hypothetical protein